MTENIPRSKIKQQIGWMPSLYDKLYTISSIASLEDVAKNFRNACDKVLSEFNRGKVVKFTEWVIKDGYIYATRDQTDSEYAVKVKSVLVARVRAENKRKAALRDKYAVWARTQKEFEENIEVFQEAKELYETSCAANKEVKSNYKFSSADEQEYVERMNNDEL